MTKKTIPGEMITEQNSLSLSPQNQKTIYSAYSQKRKISLSFAADGRTKQSFKNECDINTIMARYMKTGLLDHVRSGVGRYMDVSGADFFEAQNLVAGAKSMFFSLPSHIREQFDNNPGIFLEFMENPANAPKALEMGLINAQDVPSHPPTGEAASVQPAQSSTNVEATGGQGAPTQNPVAKPV